MFLCVAIVVSVFLQEIDLAKIEPLDFWVRDRELDTWKTNVEPLDKGSNEREGEMQFHYSIVRRDRKQRVRDLVGRRTNLEPFDKKSNNQDGDIQVHSRREKKTRNVISSKNNAQSKKKEKKRKFVDINKTTETEVTGQTMLEPNTKQFSVKTKPIKKSSLRVNKPDISNLRNRNIDKGPQEESWPRVHHRYKDKNSREIRSTRMTPVYLMQQPGNKVTTKEENRNEVESKRLRPYGILERLTQLTNTFPEANITVEVLGRTVEYNDIVLFKATERKSELGKYFRADESKYVDEVPEKKIIFIVHGLNAMGLSAMPCMSDLKYIKMLLDYYFAHLDKFDIFVIPMANPDGYASYKSFWSKNMSPQGACPGVALDRNFDVYWNASNAPNSCSQLYPGSSPFSEPETKAVREVFHRYSHKIHAYLNVHPGTFDFNTFKGDAVLYPKGYTDAQADDDKYIDLRGEIDEAMKNASFQVLSVTVDTLYNWYGKVFGTSVDYASTVYGIPYSLELVMQIFQDYEVSVSSEYNSRYALEEIWRRVIDVIFHNIWRTTKTNEIQ